MKRKSLILGIVTGTIIGSITTLLYTPKSGKNVQLLIKNKYEQMNDFMQKSRNETLALKDQVKETLEISSNTLKNVSSDLKESVDTWKVEVEPALENLQKEIDELENTVKKQK